MLLLGDDRLDWTRSTKSVEETLTALVKTKLTEYVFSRKNVVLVR